MAVHIFVTSEENYNISIKKGVVGLPEPASGKNHDNIFDGLMSRISGVKENDYVLQYIKKSKLLCGVWQIDGKPFYEDSMLWNDGRIYPFRCRIKWSNYNFPKEKALKLDEIEDLRNSGKIWTWKLERPTGSNSMFSISNPEFFIFLTEFMKKNPFDSRRGIIYQPYPYRDFNLQKYLHFQNNSPKYEFTIMSLLSIGFSNGLYTDIFGNYSDYLSYVPTNNSGKEIDFLLIYNHPMLKNQVLSYNVIEVKRDKFDESALKQLIDYESWFIQKKVAGDLNMVRTTAIAKTFSTEVIQYVNKRKEIESKPIQLLQYSYINGNLELKDVQQPLMP